MKSNTLLFKIICGGLIILSIWGIFDEHAFQFLKEVAKKNTEFLAAVTEIKMLIAGISSINIPFVSGHTTGIEDSLAKAQNYLLFTDTITFIQVLFISFSKSWLFKALLITLFLLSFFEKTKKHFSKILIVALALSPGISIYTVAVKHISENTQINFGEAYLQKLQASSEAIRAESTELMKQHSKEQTQIKNGKKHPSLMKRFEEDVSYDIKKVETKVKGDFVELRSLIKSAGREMLTKVFRFCTMILFGMFILPMGYLMVIKILIESLFRNSSLEAAIANISPNKNKKLVQHIEHTSFFQKLRNIGHAIRREFTAIEEEVEHSKEFQALIHRIEQSENRIKDELKNAVQETEDRLKSEVKAKKQQIEGDLLQKKQEVTAAVHQKVKEVESDLNDEKSTLEHKAKEAITQTEGTVKNEIKSKETELKEKTAQLENEAKDAVDNTAEDVKSEGQSILDNEEEKVLAADHTIKGDIEQLKSEAEKIVDKANDIARPKPAINI